MHTHCVHRSITKFCSDMNSVSYTIHKLPRVFSVYFTSPQSAITTFWLVLPLDDPTASMAFTTSIPLTTLPNTTCLPSSQAVLAVQRKNCEPLLKIIWWNRRMRGNKWAYMKMYTTLQTNPCQWARQDRNSRIWTGVGHTKNSWPSMLEPKVFVFEFGAVWSSSRCNWVKMFMH